MRTHYVLSRTKGLSFPQTEGVPFENKKKAARQSRSQRGKGGKGSLREGDAR
jgi:hypothetical protein